MEIAGLCLPLKPQKERSSTVLVLSIVLSFQFLTKWMNDKIVVVARSY